MKRRFASGCETWPTAFLGPIRSSLRGSPGEPAAGWGGRPDLAGAALARVRVPTLLIVGGADYVVIDLNRDALRQLPPSSRLEIIPGATHLFEEPGALEQVARLAADWFRRYVGVTARAA